MGAPGPAGGPAAGGEAAGGAGGGPGAAEARGAQRSSTRGARSRALKFGGGGGKNRPGGKNIKYERRSKEQKKKVRSAVVGGLAVGRLGEMEISRKSGGFHGVAGSKWSVFLLISFKTTGGLKNVWLPSGSLQSPLGSACLAVVGGGLLREMAMG